MTTMTSTEFRRDVGKAKREARNSPVFITDRGRPAYVLLTVDEYRRVTDGDQTIGDLLGRPEVAEIRTTQRGRRDQGPWRGTDVVYVGVGR